MGAKFVLVAKLRCKKMRMVVVVRADGGNWEQKRRGARRNPGRQCITNGETNVAVKDGRGGHL